MEYIMTIKPGKAPVFLPISRDELTLEREQELVGGHIEPVRPSSRLEGRGLPPMTMLVNEEGLIRGMIGNYAASKLVASGLVFGPAVIVAVDNEDFRPFAKEEMQKLSDVTCSVLHVPCIEVEILEDGGGDSED